jgi:hypothetical protein
MDYEKAEKIRKQSFGSLLGEQEGGLGASLKSAISQKTQAKMTGIKEKFDPMNIARAVGGKTGAAIYGKVFGRDQASMERFADVRKKRTTGLGEMQQGGGTNSSVSDALGLIYRMMLRNAEDEKLQDQLKRNQKEEEFKEEKDRNEQLIRALTGRKKPPAKKRKIKEKKPEKEKPTEPPKPTTPPGKGKGKAPTKEAPKEPAKTPEVKPKVEKAPEVKPKVEKVPPIKEAPKPTAKPSAPAPTVKPPTAAKVPPVMIGGTKGLVLGALVAAGYSKSAQANIMANVEKESNFNPRSEGIPKPEKIFSMFGPPGVKGGQPENGKNKIRFQTLQDAQDIVAAGPEAYFNKVYDGRMGNTSPGDGYKYRGRGFIQITGKDMYNRVGKLIGEDLLSNPDLANTPEVAAKIIPAFFQLKLKERNLSVESYDNIDKVNEVVGSADVKSREQRKSLAVAYANELNSGSQIDQASKENKDLKVKSNDSEPSVIINNNTNTQEKTKTTPRPQGGDDKSAYQKKVQG